MGMGERMYGEPYGVRYVVEEPRYVTPEPRYIEHPRYGVPAYEEPRARLIEMPQMTQMPQMAQYGPQMQPEVRYVVAPEAAPIHVAAPVHETKVAEDSHGVKYVQVPEALFEKFMAEQL
mmetsp:Transcript_6129/g.7349  ORF Transcript_6129/g.7349 Transcript_6129/m.7349 type:complete len:119 (+) Transcript_6129:152-508(+)